MCYSDAGPGEEEPQYSPPLCSRGGEGWGHGYIHRGREPSQAGKVETGAVDSLATSLQMFLALLRLVL